MKGRPVRSNSRSRLRPTGVVVASRALLAAACGDDDDDDDGTAASEAASTIDVAETMAPTATPADTAEPGVAETTIASEPASTDSGGGSAADAEAALEELVAAAQEEGSVTIYSSQGLDGLEALAARFEEQYPGIDVEVVRGTDGDIIPRVETELGSNTSGGDLVVTAAAGWMGTQAQAGSWVDPTASPQLAGLGDYDAAQYLHDGNYFEVGAAVLTFAWNTKDVPEASAAMPTCSTPSSPAAGSPSSTRPSGPQWWTSTYGSRRASARTTSSSWLPSNRASTRAPCRSAKR